MKIDIQNQNDVISSEDFSSVKMEVTSDLAKLEYLLSENTYSDAIGSLIRESVSNGVDTTVEAGNDNPVVVSLKKDENYQWWFKVQDFGEGISPDRLTNVISKYGASTKEKSDKSLGAFGMGFKAPFAYSSIFFLETNYNNVKYKYCFRKGEEGHVIDLLEENPTEEPNGSIVSIQVNTQDWYSFLVKCKEQLCYFKNVYFEIDEIDNKFRLEEHENWIYSELNLNTYMHICLGGVYYPIDWLKLGVDIVQIPIALKFSINEGLMPTPNREQLRYTDKAKKLIIDKIELVAEEFIDKFNSKAVLSNNIKKVWKDIGKVDKYIEIGNTGITSKISSLDKHCNKKFKDCAIKGIDTPLIFFKGKTDQILAEYTISKRVKNGRISKEKHNAGSRAILNRILEDCKIFIEDKDLTTIEKSYIKELYPECIFIQKNYKNSLKQYYTYLQLNAVSRKDWRTLITDFQTITNQFLDEVQPLSSIIIPTDYIAAAKQRLSTKVNRINILQEEIRPNLYIHGQHYPYVKQEKQKPVKLKDLRKAYNKWNIYGTIKDLEKLKALYLISRDEKYNWVILCDRDIKRIETADFKNWISLNTFLNKDNKAYTALYTAWFCNKNFSNIGYNKIFTITDRLTRLKNSKVILEEYITKYFHINNYYEKNIEDLLPREAILPRLKDIIEEWLKYLKLTKNIDSCSNSSLRTELFRYRKIRMDYQHYLKPTIEEENED